MGTSGSFGGSGGKDARDLRDNIVAWLDVVGERGDADDIDTDTADAADFPDNSTGSATSGQPPMVDLKPALSVLLNSGGGVERSDGPGGGSGGNRGRSVRSSGGVARSVGRMSRAAGRAGRLALAYSTGNRETLSEAGLNYDELQALGDPVAVGFKIIEIAFESQVDSTVADAEERDIASVVVDWILEQPADHLPTPEDVVRKTIETIIAEITLTEVTSMIYANNMHFEKRRTLERQIRDVAAEYAAQATLDPRGATEQQMVQAIESGVRDIAQIFGVAS